MTAIEDLTLMPHVQARAALAGHRIQFSVLAPVGAWLGCGVLRVLRATPRFVDGSGVGEAFVELVCGYESYERMELAP